MPLLIHPERLQGVLPEVRAFAVRCAAQMPWDVLVVCGVRTDEAQRALYAQGRTRVGAGATDKLRWGRTVTNAPTAEDTPHGRGAAVDLAPYVRGLVDWKDMGKFLRMGELAKEMGLAWGGLFKFVDADHFELPAWRSLPYPPKPQP